MNAPDKVLAIAAAEVGYLEKSKKAYEADPDVLYDKTKGAGSDNYTKYGREMHEVYPQTMDFPAAWCDCFVDWCFYKAYGVTTAQNMECGNFDDYTVNSAQMYKNKGAWYTTPEIGDQIFFKNSTRICHTGLVEEVKDGRVYPIEGNTSDKSGLIPNGGCVARKSYDLNDPCIAGYGRPLYDKPESVQAYIRGMDVNEAQGVIDFNLVKASGIKFVCMRSTRKSGKADAYFERNLAECMDKQLDYSCFKYAYAKSHEAARIEADGVINLLSGRKMPIWYDLEDNTLLPLGKDGIEGITLSFIGECKEAGYDVGIYCNKVWYDNYISDYLKTRFNFWIARYGKNTGEIMEMYKPKGENIIAWQYTSKGSVPGIVGNVDLDVLY